MKKIFVAAAMLAVMAGSASAQGGGMPQQTPEQIAARMAQTVDVMFKGIAITDAIKAKAVDIVTKASADNRAVDRAAPDAADQRKKITDKRNADLAALLSNSTDKKTLADNIAAMPQRGGRPPAGL
jgi:Spy/CpxP family protein refolding chaperone